jgi:hypothetical protein
MPEIIPDDFDDVMNRMSARHGLPEIDQLRTAVRTDYFEFIRARAIPVEELNNMVPQKYLDTPLAYFMLSYFAGHFINSVRESRYIAEQFRNVAGVTSIAIIDANEQSEQLPVTDFDVEQSIADERTLIKLFGEIGKELLGEKFNVTDFLSLP